MYGLWEGLKRIGKWCVISSVCWWVLVWSVGSWRAHRYLGIEELMPTADRWLAKWDLDGGR